MLPSEKDAMIDQRQKASAFFENITKNLLAEYAGLDPDTEHGRETPKRFLSMLQELTACSNCDESCMKWKTFKSSSNDMVVVQQIPFYSVCNHHVIPFIGHAHIAYIPNGQVAGLSKFARVVHHFARSLQVQEELTHAICHFLVSNLSQDVAVVVKAEHMCMTIRGVQAPGTYTTTAAMRGAFEDHSRTAKAEFLTYVNGKR